MVGLGLMIGASEFGRKGNQLWTESNGHSQGEEAEVWESMISEPRFDQYMKHYRFKDLRRFLPLAFQCEKLKEKGDPWWQFQWAVDEFNRLRADRILHSSWVAFDESMSAWRPRTTKTGDLPNISFIKRKPEPLGKVMAGCCMHVLMFSLNLFFSFFHKGTEFKCIACPITGVMLFLEIQRGKDGMKDQLHHRALGATAGCTVRMSERCAQVKGVKADAWFGSVLTCIELVTRGYEGIFQVKQNHGQYPKDYIEKALEKAPGGVSIVLKAVASNEKPIIAMGYRYNAKKTLFFIMSPGAGKTTPGEAYRMRYTDGFGNVMTRLVERPDVISKFFNDSNTIDSHNQSRQYDLGMEKCWVTTDAYFRLTTTLIGMNVCDTWKIADYLGIINWTKNEAVGKMSIQNFAGILGNQLIKNASTFRRPSQRFSSLNSPLFSPSAADTIMISNTSEISSISDDKENRIIIPIRTIADINGKEHHLVAYPLKTQSNGKKCTKTRACKECHSKGIRRLVRHHCYTCGLSFSFCCPSSNNDNRDCFLIHVRQASNV